MKAPPRPTSVAAKQRLFLVEDHPVTREGFARLLNFEPDLEVCGQAGSAAEALSALETMRPDLVIVDISLVGRSGLELIKDLASRHPTLPMLVLSTHDEKFYGERSLRAGARGYVMKSAATDEILLAIRQVLGGKTYLSPSMDEQLRRRLIKSAAKAPISEVEHLSDRELEIFTLIGQGRSTAQIAAALNLSPNTVATHRAHIQEKLNLAGLNELVRYAVQWVQQQA